jgi:hypothetical protein
LRDLGIVKREARSSLQTRAKLCLPLRNRAAEKESLVRGVFERKAGEIRAEAIRFKKPPSETSGRPFIAGNQGESIILLHLNRASMNPEW